MCKKIILTALLVMALSMCAFAGEGSDTVGRCKLLPQLRYGYTVSTWKTHDNGALTSPDYSAHSYYVQANWGILDNVELVGLAGGRSFMMEDAATVVVPGGFILNESETTEWARSFMWGLGARGTFWRSDSGFYVGGGALFTHTRATDYGANIYVSVEIPPFPPITMDADTGDIYHTDIYQLTADLHAGWHIKSIGLTPYIGADYSWARMVTEYEGIDGKVESHPRHPWGIYAGVDYFLNDRLYLNAEGRSDFADGWGVETGIGYMFDLCKKPAPAPEPAPAPVIEPKLEPMSSN
jgi:hypothetical protein